MKRLLTLCLSLIGTFSVIAVASISIGRGLPASKAVQYWHLTDCAPPCWAGITPNSTSQSEATDRMTRLFGDFRKDQLSDHFQNWVKDNELTDTSNMIALESGSDFLVTYVIMGGSIPAETSPTLGEVVAVFGAPICITVDESRGYSNLYYLDNSNQNIVEIGVWELSLTIPVRFLLIGSANRNCQDYAAIPWRGFRSAELYLADMANLK